VGSVGRRFEKGVVYNVRSSEKSTFKGISTCGINTVHGIMAFYLPTLIEMFRFYHFSDSLNVFPNPYLGLTSTDKICDCKIS